MQLTLSRLGKKISRRHLKYVFLVFIQKIGFDSSCKLSLLIMLNFLFFPHKICFDMSCRVSS